MRYYGRGVGKQKERAEHCIVSVPAYPDSHCFHQCHFSRGHGSDGLLCTRHAKVEEKKGREALLIPEDG